MLSYKLKKVFRSIEEENPHNSPKRSTPHASSWQGGWQTSGNHVREISSGCFTDDASGEAAREEESGIEGKGVDRSG
jgi:hypothetical protein